MSDPSTHIKGDAALNFAAPVPIGWVSLYGEGGPRRFDPQPDITPYEVALLLNLALVLMGNRSVGTPDWGAYVKEYKLERHFSEKP